jgi:hypothetical protein
VQESEKQAHETIKIPFHQKNCEFTNDDDEAILMFVLLLSANDIISGVNTTTTLFWEGSIGSRDKTYTRCTYKQRNNNSLKRSQTRTTT